MAEQVLIEKIAKLFAANLLQKFKPIFPFDCYDVADQTLNLLKEEGYVKLADKNCVKDCPVLNKLLFDYPEIKLELYLQSVGLNK